MHSPSNPFDATISLIYKQTRDLFMFKYSSGKLLFSTQSQNHPIEVRENWRYRWMHFGGPSIQSAMKKSSPHSLALPYLMPLFKGIELLQPQTKSLTLLGVGGGAVVRYARVVYPECHITGVEIDPEIIEIAARFFALPGEDDHFSLYVADAHDFLHHPPASVDTLIVDIYSNEELPASLHQNEFYEMAYAHLNEQGLLCVNIVYSEEVELLGVISAIQSVFGDKTLCVEVPSYRNVIVFAGKDPDFSNILLAAKRKQIRNLRLDSLYGYTAKLP